MTFGRWFSPTSVWVLGGRTHAVRLGQQAPFPAELSHWSSFVVYRGFEEEVFHANGIDQILM